MGVSCFILCNAFVILAVVYEGKKNSNSLSQKHAIPFLKCIIPRLNLNLSTIPVTDVGRVFDFFRCSLLSSLDTAVSIFFSPS